VIEPEQVTEFEDASRAELVPGGRVERAAEEPQYAWNGKVIAPNPTSWKAYLAWTEFCRRQAAVLSWRARDVEMAVWSDKDARLPLDE